MASSPETKADPHVQSSAISEDSLKQFVTNTLSVPPSTSQSSLKNMLNSIREDSARFIQSVNFLNQAFSDPNSPFRNEELYIIILRTQITSSWYSEVEKEVINNKLKLSLQNRPGNSANNFTYLTHKGVSKKMYDIKSPFTLLYFYNPECHACKEIKDVLTSSSVITEQLHSGRLQLLAMYTDLDEDIWRRHLPENPKSWLNGRDTSEYLWRNKIYDLRAIPTLYLLDEQKKVLLKDATADEVILFLKSGKTTYIRAEPKH